VGIGNSSWCPWAAASSLLPLAARTDRARTIGLQPGRREDLRRTWRRSGVSKKTRLFSSIPSLEEGRKPASTCVILAHVRSDLRPSTSPLVRVCLPHLSFAAPRRARLNQHIQTHFTPSSIFLSLHCAALDYTSTYRHLLAPPSPFCYPAPRPEPLARKAPTPSVISRR